MMTPLEVIDRQCEIIRSQADMIEALYHVAAQYMSPREAIEYRTEIDEIGEDGYD